MESLSKNDNLTMDHCSCQEAHKNIHLRKDKQANSQELDVIIKMEELKEACKQ